MNDPNVILSVGVDVGTTSMHLAVSRLTLANISRANEPTRLVVAEREIVYQSPIYFTPLSDDGSIDADGVQAILNREYETASLSAVEISTGAVIITGETAKRRNASEVVHALSRFAGSFVAASAGPNLESILAGRGSGAAAFSKERGGTICNVDIGGGTTNIALFQNGEAIQTSWLPLGGRLMRIDAASTNKDEAARFADQMASGIIDEIVKYKFDELWFSGGVGELMRADAFVRTSDTEYGDVGVYLARSMVMQLLRHSLEYMIPENAIRATVIGAGSQLLQLSGSTVCVAGGALPIQNLPIVRLMHTNVPEGIDAKLRQQFAAHDLNWNEQPTAILFPDLPRMGYHQLTEWGTAICTAIETLRVAQPYVIICTHDVAAALGQVLRAKLPDAGLIVLDGIANGEGDYIDIGAMLPHKQSIPVVIKDLIFAS